MYGLQTLSVLQQENNILIIKIDFESLFMFIGGTMKQKYSILKDIQNHQLIIREYAALDKDVFSLLCEETYADQTIQSVIKSGKESLISTLRTKNLYPPVTYADKIAEAVISLYGLGDYESTDLFFDDVELLAGESASLEIEPETGEDSEDLEELLDDDLNGSYQGNAEIKKLDSSLKISDDDSVRDGADG